MRILVFGDSIVQGRCDDECFGWTNRLGAHCQRIAFETDWEEAPLVFNLGIAGDRLDKLEDRFDAEFDRRSRSEPKNTITIFAYGLNDSVQDINSGENVVPLDMFRSLYKGFVEKALPRGCAVLIGLTPIDEYQLNPIPWWEGHAYSTDGRERYNDAVRTLSIKTGSLFISMDGVFSASDTTVDGIHPNAEGHRLIFERVKGVLKTEGLL